MKILKYFILLLLAIPCYADTINDQGASAPKWQEVDGSPTGRPGTIVTPTGSLSFNGRIMSLDVVTNVSGDSTYARLDGSNQPFTGNLNVSKADPEFRLTDTGNSEYARLTRSDTTNLTTLYNRVNQIGATGSAYDFNVATTGTVTDAPSLTPATALTISFWVYGSSEAADGLLRKTNEYNVYKTTTGAGLLYFVVGTTTNNLTASVSSSPIHGAAWHHIVCKWDGGTDATNVEIWIDGTEESYFSRTETGTFVAPIVGTANNMTIGAGTGSVTNAAFDELVIWDRDLADTDIPDLYASGAGLYVTTGNFPTSGASMTTGLMALYHIDDGSGTQFLDTSGNSNTCNLTGAGGSWGTGLVVFPSTTYEVTTLKSYDGTGANERGRQQLGYYSGAAGTYNIYEGLSHNFNILGTTEGTMTSTGLTWIDSYPTYYGTASDASIQFDGNSLNIVANAVTATDDLEITADVIQVNPTTHFLTLNKIAFTQTDGNEYIDSLADGYLDLGATTQVRSNANVNISKADPEMRLTDTGNNYYTRLTKSDTSNLTKRLSQILYSAVNVNQVPTMTSNTAPSGVASASSEFSGTLQAWKAFNHTATELNDCWFSTFADGAPWWLRYQFSGAVVISGYKVWTRVGGDSAGRKPKNWTFEGSNTGAFAGEQTILDTQTNQFDATGTADSKSYTFSNSTSYAYYQINISANWSNDYTTIAELEMYPPVTSTEEINVWSAQDSATNGERGVITIGDYLLTAGTHNTYEGLSHNFNILGTTEGVLSASGLTWIDNFKTFFGTASDASIAFDGNSLNIVANAVTSTDTLEMTAASALFTLGGGSAIRMLGAGTSNLFLGALAGNTAASGHTYNVGIGAGVLPALTSGDYNIAIGTATLPKVTTGSYNVAMGDNAGYGIIAGARNFALGTSADGGDGDHSDTVAIGYGALAVNKANYNIAIGSQAFYSVITGSENVGIGFKAGYSNTGQRSVLIGQSAGTSNTGSFNVCIGAYADYTAGTGATNTIIGYDAAEKLTNGSSNVFLGAYAGKYTTTESNQFLVNNVDRTSAALDLTGSLLYGTFAAAPAAQQLTINAGTLTFNSGLNTDLVVNFTGTTNSGVLTWMEDEDYFQFSDGINLGGATNFVNISDDTGQVTWGGTYKRKLTLRPGLIDVRTKVSDNKPTEVQRGCNTGYSMPIWNDSTNVEEELYFRMRIPVRWDGVTYPQFGICVSTTVSEDVGDAFKFEMSWQTTNKGNIMGTVVDTVSSDQVILTGRNDAYDTYFVFFNLSSDSVTNPIVAGEMLQARIRRAATAGTEVTGEIAIWDWASMWAVDKVYGAWSVETNDS